MKENSKRYFKLLISIIVTILVLGGATYAAWSYLTEKTNVVMNIDGNRINYNAGEDLTVNNMLPVYDKEDGAIKNIEIYEEETKYRSGINLFLDLKTWPIELSDKSFRWALYKNDNYLTSGDFKNHRQGDKIKLTREAQKINTVNNKDTYTLYLWIDAYQESNINMINKSFTVTIYGEVTFYDSAKLPVVNDVEPNSPELAEGMIPVKYDYITDNWVKADSTNANNDWYNYDEKYWANAVMVTTETRSTYMNASVNTQVMEDDILAYYVWIPRYKYVLFNTTSGTIEPEEIQIEFQKTTDTIEEGTHDNEFLTHPAFWWDNNSDGVRDTGEELSGLWVGKFETGGTPNVPLVKPDILSINSIGMKTFFDTNKNIGTTTYLTNNGAQEVDAHMMKNTEWGVVAYLSHSRYGTNAEICVNNSSDKLTGRSAGDVGNNINTAKVQYPSDTTSTYRYSSGGYYTYNDKVVSHNGDISLTHDAGMGTCASTTGNISGIYDMAGGGADIVMAFTKTEAGAIYYIQGSGLNASNMPDSKYYDLYEYGSSSSDHQRRILGDATGETRSWYSDYATFIYNNIGAFSRGGCYSGAIINYQLDTPSSVKIGIFYYGLTSGGSYYISNNPNIAYRSVLVLP